MKYVLVALALSLVLLSGCTPICIYPAWPGPDVLVDVPGGAALVLP